MNDYFRAQPAEPIEMKLSVLWFFGMGESLMNLLCK